MIYEAQRLQEEFAQSSQTADSIKVLFTAFARDLASMGIYAPAITITVIIIITRAADRLIFLIVINRAIKKINRNINRIYICYV